MMDLSLSLRGDFNTRYWFTGSSDSWGKFPLAVCEKEVIILL